MDAAALSSMPQTHPRTDPLSLPPSHFVPTQPQRLTTNCYQSPYFYRTSGLLQIAVSALLHATSVEVREVLDAEHCRYGTRDLATTEAESLGRIAFYGTNRFGELQ
jgi:hypothetical protein